MAGTQGYFVIFNNRDGVQRAGPYDLKDAVEHLGDIQGLDGISDCRLIPAELIDLADDLLRVEQKGFTLIEICVMISIIAMLGAIGFMSYMQVS